MRLEWRGHNDALPTGLSHGLPGGYDVSETQTCCGLQRGPPVRFLVALRSLIELRKHEVQR